MATTPTPIHAARTFRPAAVEVFDFEAPAELRPMSSQTRAALVAEFKAARDARDVKQGREIYKVAVLHDEAYPDEPSLLDEIVGLHIAALTGEAA